jgi:biopolymer transport protein ExbD
MRLQNISAGDEPGIDLTSLIDVVFTLIIFFVVTTSFNQRSALKLELPKAQANSTANQNESLLVMVDAQGQYFVGNTQVLQNDLQSLKDALAQVGGNRQETPVILRADAKAPHQAVVTVLDALGQTGYTRISIATQSESNKQ